MQKNKRKRYKLKDLVNINASSVSTKDNLSCILYLDTGSVIAGKIKELLEVSYNNAPSRAKRKVKNNSIVYSMVRPNQLHYGLIKNPSKNMIVSTGFAVIDCYEERANSKFIYYWLTQSCITNFLQAIAENSTSAYPAIRPEDLENLDISLPSLEEQKRIADILGAFDDKIELLQKQNKTLEDMAKAIFKSWFVDFDVVKAKQRGDSKADIMREYHLTEELYDLFPSSFEDSSLGPIPAGWEVKSAGELLEFSIGGGWGNEELTEDFFVEAPVIRGTDIPALRSFGTYKSVPVRYHKRSNHTSRKLKSGDIVLEVAGGSKGQPVGRALFISDYIVKYLPEVICASFCKLLRLNKNLLLPELFYIYLDFMYQTGEIEQYQVQSTGISNFQFKQFCENKQFVVPPRVLQTKLSLGIFIDKISNNNKQIQTLTELRDSLLPRLISGKIRV